MRSDSLHTSQSPAVLLPFRTCTQHTHFLRTLNYFSSSFHRTLDRFWKLPKQVQLIPRYLLSGLIRRCSLTGLCRQQQKKMVAAIEKAWDHGEIRSSPSLIIYLTSLFMLGMLVYPIPRKMPEEGFRIPPWNKVDIT